MSKAQDLLDLQALDRTLDQLNKRLAEVKAALHETNELINARRAAQQAEQATAHDRATRKDLELNLAGRDVLVVEDIIDSGLTLSYLRRTLGARKPASLEICALLTKPERREVEVPVRYVGFEIPNRFVIGYGLDFAERYRNLPYVGVLDPALVPEGAHDAPGHTRDVEPQLRSSPLHAPPAERSAHRLGDDRHDRTSHAGGIRESAERTRAGASDQAGSTFALRRKRLSGSRRPFRLASRP